MLAEMHGRAKRLIKINDLKFVFLMFKKEKPTAALCFI
jgi:hypothetical protein